MFTSKGALGRRIPDVDQVSKRFQSRFRPSWSLGCTSSEETPMDEVDGSSITCRHLLENSVGEPRWRIPLENSVGEPRSVPFDSMAYSRLICIHVSHIIFGVTYTCQELWVSFGNLCAHESKVLCQMLQQQRQLECSEC